MASDQAMSTINISQHEDVKEVWRMLVLAAPSRGYEAMTDRRRRRRRRAVGGRMGWEEEQGVVGEQPF